MPNRIGRAIAGAAKDAPSGLGSMIGRGLKRTGNALLSTLGSASATGRLDQQDVQEYLSKQYAVWRGRVGQEPSLVSIDEFLQSNYDFSLWGDTHSDIEDDDREEVQSEPENVDSREETKPEEKKAPPKAAKEEPASNPADDEKRALLRAKAKLATRINSDEAVALINSMIGNAVHGNGLSKKNVAAFIDGIRNDTRIMSRFPELSNIDTGPLNESKGFGAVKFIIENNIPSDEIIPVLEFIMEDYREARLTPMQVNKVMGQVARTLIARGAVSFGKSERDASSTSVGLERARGSGRRDGYRDTKSDNKSEKPKINMVAFRDGLKRADLPHNMSEDVEEIIVRSNGDFEKVKKELERFDDDTTRKVMIALLGAMK